MKNKILLTGGNGMLAYAFLTHLDEKYDVTSLSKQELDITDKDAVSKYFDENSFDIVIHCAAYTKVDLAEDESDKCFLVNRDGTQNIAISCKKINATMVYFSTDYVFDGGKNNPYTEEDDVNPINVYGKSKLAGEDIIKNVLSKYFILRVSWLFGEKGNNFPNTMINLSKTKNEIGIVSDQIGSPTYTVDIVKQTEKLLETKLYGLYNASSEGLSSWFDIAKEVFAIMNIKTKLNKIKTKDFDAKAPRPLFSYLENSNLKKLNMNIMPKWNDGLYRYIQGIKNA